MAKRLVVTKDCGPFNWDKIPESVQNAFFRATLEAAQRYYGIEPQRDRIAKIYKGEETAACP